jgi:hypothetical protein
VSSDRLPSGEVASCSSSSTFSVAGGSTTPGRGLACGDSGTQAPGAVSVTRPVYGGLTLHGLGGGLAFPTWPKADLGAGSGKPAPRAGSITAALEQEGNAGGGRKGLAIPTRLRAGLSSMTPGGGLACGDGGTQVPGADSVRPVYGGGGRKELAVHTWPKAQFAGGEGGGKPAPGAGSMTALVDERNVGGRRKGLAVPTQQRAGLSSGDGRGARVLGAVGEGRSMAPLVGGGTR